MRTMRTRAAFVTVLLAVSLAACTAGGGPLRFSPDRLPEAQSGQPYSAIISVTNNDTPVGDISVSGGALPAGMTLDFTNESSMSATLSGTPTAVGSYVFTVSAWCLGTNTSGQTGEQNYSLVVN
jgi:large repetitive protein